MKNKPKPLHNALLFFMRITLINILITSVSIVLGYAIDTKGQEVLNQKLTLQVENAEIKTILAEIEKKVDVKFTYRPRVIRDHNKLSLNVTDASLNEVLGQVLGTSIDFEVVGKQIVLTTVEPDNEPFNALGVTVPGSPVVQVSGTVTDESDVPLPGVNVLVKGTTLGTTTDVNGKYALEIQDLSSILVFSFIGYLTQEVEVGSRTSIDVKLVLDVQSLEEVVVVGYGEQKKVTVTGAVVAVDGKELQKSPAIDLSNSFAGRLAGVVAVQTSGEPGYDGSTIRIRGVNTIGNTSPLVVIDGIPDRDGGLNRLSPQDIETISVLKDASSAIYGSRAANGVILITTKRGKSGKPAVTYDFNYGWAQPTRIPEMSNAVEYANIMNEIPIYKVIRSDEWTQAWQSIQQTGAYTGTGWGGESQTVNANYYPDDVQKFADGSDPWGHPDTDWFGDAFKEWAPQTRHNLQISGGSENVKYMASLGYIYQDAIYKNSATFYEQYNLRINTDFKISKYLDANLGVLLREEDRNFPTQSAGSIFRMLMRGRPTEPEVWPNGLPGPDIENGQNPYVITTNATGYEKNPTDYIQTNGSLSITNPWISGLKLTLMAAVDKTINKTKKWETPWYLYRWDGVSYEDDGVTPELTKSLRSTFTDPRLTMSNGDKLNTNLTALLNYDKTVGDHNLGILVGVTREKFTAEYFSAYRREYISAAIDQPFFGGPTQLVGGGDNNENTYNRARLGYYGRVTYNYKEKYLAEFLWRYDGSSFFPEDHRFGFFPGVLVGWNISDESFFQNVSFVNFLKLRASYGQMGNDQIYYPGTTTLVEYAYLSSYLSDSYPINSQVATTLFEGLVANDDFTWEVSNNSNIGLEGTLFGNRIDFTLEYFFNKRKQMLIFKRGSTPATTGIEPRLPPTNGGIMENKGYEFTIGYNGEVSGLTFRIGVNAGYNKNKVIYMDEVSGAPSYQWQTGHPWGAYVAYKSDGVFLNEEEIASETIDYSGVTNRLMPGDMKFVDYNKDGKINADDKVTLDNTNVPNFNYGITMNFEYKNFDLSILFQGAKGALLRFGTESGDIGNYLKYSHDHRWSIDNPSSTHPRLAIRNDTYYTGGGYSANTYNLFDKDYLRLKNVELGYNFPAGVINKVWLSNLRVYVNGLNLVTWDKYKIFDPEADSGSLQYYPQSRVITMGVRLTF